MQNKIKKFAGFTLIELLVTIVIIGILATISISTFGSYQEKATIATFQANQTQIERLFQAESTLSEISMPIINQISNSVALLKQNGFTDYSNKTIDIDIPTSPSSSGLGFRESNLRNGSNYINFPTGEFTISLLVKPLNTHHTILTLSAGSGKNIAIGSNPSVSIFRGKNGGFLLLRDTGATGAVKNKWNHIIATHGNGKTTLYLNGKKFAENSNSHEIYETYNSLTIGSIYKDHNMYNLKIYPFHYQGK